MDSVFKFFYHEINEILGIPSRLIELIEKRQLSSTKPNVPNDVSCSAVIKWNEWLGSSPYNECHYTLRNKIDYCNIKSNDINSLIIKEESLCEIEIQDINSLSASKSDLSSYSSLDDAALKMSSEHIKQMNMEGLESCLSHLNKRAWKDEYISLNHYSWHSKNYLWDNGDGSHHFVAAKYIAKNICEKVYKKAKITKYTVDKGALHSFLSQNEMFLFNEVEYHLNDILKNFGSSFGYLDLPSPLNEYNPNTKILILPNNKRNIAVSKILSKYNFFSWNKFMKDNLG